MTRSSAPILVEPIVESADLNFRPVDLEVGPDGALYILDWHNPIIGHMHHHLRDPSRDVAHGRVYRVVPDGSKTVAPKSRTLGGADEATLVNALKDTNMFWRMHAQRILVEQGGKGAAQQLIALINDQTVDAVGLNAGVIHALWTLKGLGVIDADQAEGSPVRRAVALALRHPSAGVRRNAVKVLPLNVDSVSLILSSGLLGDADAQTRSHFA